MRQVQLIFALATALSGNVLTEGLTHSHISHQRSRDALTRSPTSRILTRNLNPTKSTLRSNPTHSERMASKKGDGSDIDEDITLMEAESRNTSKKIKNLVQDDANSIQFKAVSVYLLTTIVLAKMDKIGLYDNNLIVLDLGATAFVGIASVLFVKTITKLSTDGILQARDSRKIIHMFSAPIFMIFWPLFSDAWGARLFAGLITFLQSVRLLLAGTKRGGSEGDELANAISRSGNSEEALGGPFIYTVVLFLTILVLWRDTLAGVIVLSTMAAGDGAADIVGRRLGKNNKWFFSEDKSIAGSLAFFVASTLCSIGIAWWFNFTGVVTLSDSLLIITEKIALISAICAMVELLPFGDDNWSVPISAAVLSMVIL